MNLQPLRNLDYDNAPEGIVFFAQRLDELLFDYTIDIYKPTALNAPSLCAELLALIQDVELNNIDRKNIESLLSELKDSIKEDSIAKSLLIAPIDHFLAYNEELPLETLRSQISVLDRCLERYRYYNALQNELLICITENRKKNIDFLVKNLVTTFINWGISKQFLFSEFKSFFDSGETPVSSIEQIKDFLAKIKPIEHTFSVFFKVTTSFLRLKDSFSFFGITVPSNIEEQTQNSLNSISLGINKPSTVLCIEKIRCADPFTARKIAENRIETLKNTSQFYHHLVKAKWSKLAVIVQNCCKQKKIIANRPVNPLLMAFNNKSDEVAKKLENLFKMIQLDSESFGKFRRVIELHSNALSNYASENQVVNLWTMFETIVPPSKNKSKVVNVIDSVVNILLLNYFKRILANILSDLKRWNCSFVTSILESVKGSSELHKLAALLSDVSKQEQVNSVYSELGNLHLLRNRIFRTAEILRNRDKILSKLESYKKNVERQFRRLYRTRNLTVHVGSKSPTYFATLIENSHEFLDQVIEYIILLSTSDYFINDLKQAFGIAQLSYEKMVFDIKTEKSEAMCSQFLFPSSKIA